MLTAFRMNLPPGNPEMRSWKRSGNY